MKKSTSLLSIIIVMMCIFVASCEKATEYVKPTVSGLAIKPNPCTAGDTVKAYLTYAVPGDCWYWYSQTFSIPADFKKTSEWRGTCNDPSFIFFVVPEGKEGEYNISFKGQITITSGKELWGDSYEFSEKLIVQ